MSSNKQEQSSGKDSTNMLAGRDMTVIVAGLSYSDARQIAKDVFKENFLELQGEAQRIAQERAEELVEAYLARLQKENIPLDEIKDPDMQYTLFSAQKDYARMGKENLKEILIDVLVERTKSTNSEMTKIVLTESIQVAPKLTSKQLNAISICFYVKYFRDISVNSVETLNAYLTSKLLPLCKELACYASDYQHIEYVGAGSVGTFHNSFFHYFSENYSGVLSIGFDEVAIESIELSKEQRDRLFIPCLRDKEKWQIAAINHKHISDIGKQLCLDKEQINALKKLQNKYILSEKEMKAELVLLDNSFSELFQIWDNVSLGQLRLTTVGISLAHANIKRMLGIALNLNTWIQTDSS